MNASAPFRFPLAGPRGVYFWLPGFWLLIASAFLVIILYAEHRRIEQDLRVLGDSARDQILKSLRDNEAVLEGFAALLESMEQCDTDVAAGYARRVLRQYPHIYMLEVAARVRQENLAAFERALGARHPGYRVREFSYQGDRQWRPVGRRDIYYPLVFAAPQSAEADQILGLDIGSVPMLRQAMARCSESTPFVASHPFQLVEGERAYVLHRNIHADGRAVALLVVKTESLLAGKLRAGRSGVSYRLWHSDFAADDHDGMVWDRPGQLQGSLGWLPSLRLTYAVRGSGQPFTLRLEKDLAWSDFNLLLIGGVAAMASMVFALLLVFGRARIQQEANQRRYTAELLHMAQHDALTGLPNRSLLMDRLYQARARAVRNHHRFALLFMDVDRFKQVNDRHGHPVGDHLLQTIANTLRDGLRAQDTVARISGDEFVAILEPVGEREHALAIAGKLSQALLAASRGLHPDLDVGFSIGLAVYPDDGRDVEALMQHADSDMYVRKKAAGGTAG